MGFGAGFTVGFGLAGSFFFLLTLMSQWRLDQAATDLVEVARELKNSNVQDRDDADWWKSGRGED